MFWTSNSIRLKKIMFFAMSLIKYFSTECLKENTFLNSVVVFHYCCGKFWKSFWTHEIKQNLSVHKYMCNAHTISQSDFFSYALMELWFKCYMWNHGVCTQEHFALWALKFCRHVLSMITHNSTRVIYSWPVTIVCWASRWVTHLACGFIFLLV